MHYSPNSDRPQGSLKNHWSDSINSEGLSVTKGNISGWVFFPLPTAWLDNDYSANMMYRTCLFCYTTLASRRRSRIEESISMNISRQWFCIPSYIVSPFSKKEQWNHQSWSIDPTRSRERGFLCQCFEPEEQELNQDLARNLNLCLFTTDQSGGTRWTHGRARFF